MSKMVIYASDGQGNNCMMLAATMNAAGTARRYASSVLGRWGLDALQASANLLVTELVTNAIKATGIAKPDPTYGEIYESVKPIFLCLYKHSGRIVIEVWDASREVPKRRAPSDDDEGGRGMILIEGIAEAWGYRWPKSGGKVVWCTVVLNGHAG